MKKHVFSRRRAIQIIGCVAAAPLFPTMSYGATNRARAWRHWEGEAMGASSSIDLYLPNANASNELISRCLELIADYENLFSLHKPDSAISTLNRQGYLENTNQEFTGLLRFCHEIHSQTDGAFDVTVQPLWQVYADHFWKGKDPDQSGPTSAEIERERAVVGQNFISIEDNVIRFQKSDMQITLNGVAQGYITDRIADLLKANGVERVLVNLGEMVAIGDDANGQAWRAGLMDPRQPSQLSGDIGLKDVALATSGGYGLQFDQAGQFNHILDPSTGRSPAHNLAVCVTAPSAALADALSTAFSVMPLDKIETVVASERGVGAMVTLADGAHRRFGAFPSLSVT